MRLAITKYLVMLAFFLRYSLSILLLVALKLHLTTLNAMSLAEEMSTMPTHNPLTLLDPRKVFILPIDCYSCRC